LTGIFVFLPHLFSAATLPEKLLCHKYHEFEYEIFMGARDG